MDIALGVVISVIGILVTWLITAFYYRKTSQKLVEIVKGDKIKPPTALLEAHPITAKTGVGTSTISRLSMSKDAAQKRLDKDTKRVGFVRGEVYELEDGTWGIHWKMEGTALLGLITVGSHKTKRKKK